MTVSGNIPRGREVVLQGGERFGLPLLEVGRALVSLADVQSLLMLTIAKAVEGIESADAGLICLYDNTQGKLMVKAAFGYGQEVWNISANPERGGAPGMVYKTRRSRIWSSPEEVSGLIASLDTWDQQHLTRARRRLPRPTSVVCSPLMAKDRFIGCIHLEHYANPAPFSMCDLALLHSFAEQVSLAVENAMLFKEMQRKETTWSELLYWLLIAREYERRRIMSVLEDDVNQVLEVLDAELKAPESELKGLAGQHQGMRAMRDNLYKIVDEMHSLSPSTRVVPLGGEGESYDGLTSREKQIIRLVAEGRTNKEIADLLCISIRTVQSHRANIMEKLEMHDRTELVRYAIRKGLVTP